MSTSIRISALEGKIALIGGASSGIGEAAALGLAAQGARVVLAARRVERLEGLRRRVMEAGGQAVVVAADLSRKEDVEAMFGQIAGQFGRLDILVNSAGVMLLAPIAQADEADWRRMIEINLFGLMLACKEALPLMKRGGGGHIINIASLAGRVANPNASAYAATKFGVVGFSESLRREVFADNIRVTVIEPGLVATELGDHITNAAMKANLAQRTAALDPLQAEDIAAAIVYAATQPMRVNVNEILLRPTGQER